MSHVVRPVGPCAVLRSFAPALALALAATIGGSSQADALGTTRVASGLKYPVHVAAPGGDTRLFIVEQNGEIKLLKNGAILPLPFLDMDFLVPNVSGGDERGLLSMAFHPNYASNRYFYVYYVNQSQQGVVARFRTLANNPDLCDVNTRYEILQIPHEFPNHYGGYVAFGPDGYLYISSGDGGGVGDPSNRAQDLTDFRGKILRIDIDGGDPYAIPPTNPFVGVPGAAEEIFAYGLRNPWRISFDSATGDMWIGDVGQATKEEIDRIPAGTSGQNFGWRLMEGSGCYNPPINCPTGGLTFPVWEYEHGDNGFSVTGGFVYRGFQHPEVFGHYFFADYVTARIWSFKYVGGQVTELFERTAELDPPGALAIGLISSFGQGPDGELYIIDRDSSTQGEVYKMVESTTDAPGFDPPSLVFLAPSYPNPFRTDLRIPVTLMREGSLSLDVLDLSGRRIQRVATGQWAPGTHLFGWDGKDASGQPSAAGSYVLRVLVDGQQQSHSVRLLR